MTKELAIRIITGDVLGTSEQTHEAVTMAVKALSMSEVPDNNVGDTISRQAAIDALEEYLEEYDGLDECGLHSEKWCAMSEAKMAIEALPSAQPEQRYTEEELRVFAHGISLSLLSKRSAQHWQYDEDTATEIKFLERLYEKVGADMRGEQE